MLHRCIYKHPIDNKINLSRHILTYFLLNLYQSLFSNQICIYLHQNFPTMKLIWSILTSGCCLLGCTNKELPTKYLSTISVVRETENMQQSIPSQTVPIQQAENIPVPQNSQQGIRYHVIVSSFGINEKERAEKLVTQLKVKNYPATLLYSSKRYRVSIESFTSESEANTARDEYRISTDRQDIWVHKVE